MKKQTALSSRAYAALYLFQVLYQGKSLSSLLAQASSLTSQDQALLQEICFGVCRVLPRLEQIITHLVKKPLKGKTRLVQCLLLVGLYQLLYLRVPPHAAVDEIVNSAKSLQVDSFKGLLNAVLRQFLRQQKAILHQVDAQWQSLHPEWLVQKLKKAYPNPAFPHSLWCQIVEANNQRPPMWIRVNPKNTLAQYQALLEQEGIRYQSGSHPQALRLTPAIGVAQLPQFSKGAVSVQDLHAQWAGILLEVTNHQVILDACAAPGGKTTHILELAPQAQVYALDCDPQRLTRVEQNLTRLNQQAVILCGDASQPSQWLTENMLFDRILLDAPCSATGVIRRHPDIKWLRKEADIPTLVTLQQQILQALWQQLKPNGILLYATCSVLPEENCLQIAKFLHSHPDAKLLDLPFTPAQEIGHQFLPTPEGGDGFYYAKLQKIAR